MAKTRLSQTKLTGLLSLISLQALAVCQSNGEQGIWQSELVACLGISPAQGSSLVEALGESGHLESYRAVADRRRQYWRLTGLGRKKLEEFHSEAEATTPRPDEFPKESARLLISLLQQFCTGKCGSPYPRVARLDESDANPQERTR